jgi:hypothetical protein
MNLLIFVIAYFYLNRKDKMYIRRVPGLDAIEEAIGRSTEMGKPHFAMIGVGMFNEWTMAALAMLEFQAHICARTDTTLLVPTGGSTNTFITRPVALDMVKNAYIAEGKTFDDKDMPFLAGGKGWAFGAGTVALIQKLRPGSLVLTGQYGSVALHIAEQSSQSGAMTIASGSYMGNVAALSAASDYTMIGEEVLAAGAYLTQEPSALASIRTQDILKFIAIAATVIGILLIQGGSDIIIQILKT